MIGFLGTVAKYGRSSPGGIVAGTLLLIYTLLQARTVFVFILCLSHYYFYICHSFTLITPCSLFGFQSNSGTFVFTCLLYVPFFGACCPSLLCHLLVCSSPLLPIHLPVSYLPSLLCHLPICFALIQVYVYVYTSSTFTFSLSFMLTVLSPMSYY